VVKPDSELRAAVNSAELSPPVDPLKVVVDLCSEFTS
jgi:hypothetical protein